MYVEILLSEQYLVSKGFSWESVQQMHPRERRYHVQTLRQADKEHQQAQQIEEAKAKSAFSKLFSRRGR